MYDVKKQYRCDIIRGKAQSQLEDMLPAYAKVISDICPIEKDEFEEAFNKNLIQYLPSSSREKKTLDNHRTEIAGKLFGMYVNSSDGKVYCSERTRKFLADGDIPAFFKDICYKMQFPNVMQKINTVSQRLEDEINIRANCYVIKVLEEAEKRNINLTKRDIGVYVLNSLDVLQRKASVTEVMDFIEKDKSAGIYREIEGDEADSKKYQHINEQLNYLELANLIYIDGKKIIHLNRKEQKSIELFSQNWNSELLFKFDKSDVSDSEHFKNLQCSSDYGTLLISEELNKNLLIDYLRAQEFQKIVMLKPSTSCPKPHPHPRTLYYMSVKPKEDPYQYKFVEGTEEVIIKNPNYFVITNTFSTSYIVKYFAANYNGVFTNKTKGWNYNYLWGYYDQIDSSVDGLYQKQNKYQLIGKFPVDST